MWSPTVTTGNARVLGVLSVTRSPGKKAARQCPCGYLGDGTDRCHCTPGKLEHYRGRISGPLLDRFDLHIEVPRVPFEDIAEPTPGNESAELRSAHATLPQCRMAPLRRWAVRIYSARLRIAATRGRGNVRRERSPWHRASTVAGLLERIQLETP